MPADDASPRVVSVNQIVARNMAYYRKAAGLTQERLGEMLGGWSVTAVSAAERSWDGKRLREFDATTLLVLSRALGIPILGLLLPPDEEAPYLIDAGAGNVLSQSDYFAQVMPDSDGGGTVMEDYRNKLTAASLRYQDAGWGDDVHRLLRQMTETEVRAERLARLDWEREALLSAAAHLEEFGDLIRGESP